MRAFANPLFDASKMLKWKQLCNIHCSLDGLIMFFLCTSMLQKVNSLPDWKIIATSLVQGREPVSQLLLPTSLFTTLLVQNLQLTIYRTVMCMMSWERYLYMMKYMYVSYNYCSVPAKYPLQHSWLLMWGTMVCQRRSMTISRNVH